MTVEVLAYDTAHPGDVRELSRNLERFDPARIRRLALLVKTEGNSDVNDFSREYAMQSASLAIEKHGGPRLLERSTFLFSTGCEGAMTPFGYLFVDFGEEAKPSRASALAIGCARSRSLAADEIGTPAHADITAETVNKAMADAGVRPADVGLVIVKTPVMSHAAAGKRITSAHSKAVGALGAGVALGEVDRRKIVQEAFDTDHSLHAKRAMVFSGSELDCVEIMLLANRPGACGKLFVEMGYLRDLLDAKGLRGRDDDQGRRRARRQAARPAHHDEDQPYRHGQARARRDERHRRLDPRRYARLHLRQYGAPGAGWRWSLRLYRERRCVYWVTRTCGLRSATTPRSRSPAARCATRPKAAPFCPRLRP
jgi:cyanuric acid amidohydrolase